MLAKTRRDVDLAALRHPRTSFAKNWPADSAAASAPPPFGDPATACAAVTSRCSRKVKMCLITETRRRSVPLIRVVNR